ncbi:MAG TPA: hypothetical protein VNN79_22095 [Actinomycetota bacterium]|nr:hypothetical protein [Actinomycetota bacterium]
MTRLPSNVTYRPLREHEWMRDDSWNEPGPLSRDDLGTLIRMAPAAVVVVAAFFFGIGFALAVLA